MNASSCSFRWRSMSIRLLTTAERFSLVASEVSTKIPRDIGPVVAGMRRLRTIGEVVVSSHTEGGGCDFELLTGGGLIDAVCTGFAFSGGRAATGGGVGSDAIAA